MYPVIKIGNLELYTYTILMIVGICLGLLVVFLKLYKKEPLLEGKTIKFIICLFVGSIYTFLGAFLFDGLFHTIQKGTLSFGGITYLGGVVIGFPMTIISFRLLITKDFKKAISLFSLLIPGIILAHAIGRVGCFFGGCCYGAITDSWIGVKFPKLNYKVIPTQLIEAGFELLLFILMTIFDKKIKGHQLEMYLIIYAIFRFIIEFYRGDSRGITGLSLSPGQLLSIVCLICGMAIIIYKKRSSNEIRN